MLNHGRALAMNTFRETVRDRIFYIVAVFGLVLIGSSAVLAPLTIGAQGKIVADVGLGSMSLFGLLVVLLVGSSMLHKELDKRTLSTILTKPVTRGQYLCGKFCGLTMTLLCMLVLMSLLFLVIMLVCRVTPHPRFLAAFYLTFLELTVINAAVLLFSTFVSPVLAAVFTLCLFVIGHLSESLVAFGQVMGGAWQNQVTRILYHVIPNLEVFNIRGAVVHGQSIAFTHLLLATVYCLVYVLLFMLLASLIFARKELR
jgi:ABC-type transport system involved in multi-copper enzyme maturation permease subunit